MMLKILFIVIMLLSTSLASTGQVKKKSSRFYNTTEIGYGHGVGNIKLKTFNSKIPYEGHFFRLRSQLGYFLTEQISMGVGFGLDGYHEFTANTAPVFIDARYFFSTDPQSFYAGLNIGKSLSISDNFESGKMYSILAGKKISTRKLILLPSIAFHIQQLDSFPFFGFDPAKSQTILINETVDLRSITVNLGILF